MSRLVLDGGRLFTGTDTAVIDDAVVVIDGDRIVAVGTRESIVVDGEPVAVLDTRGKTLMPGLIDAHAHIAFDGDHRVDLAVNQSPLMLAFRATRNLQRALRAGITTLRDAGAPFGISLAAKQAVAAGVLPGPRLVVCGAALAITGGHAHHMTVEVDGADGMAKGAREQIKAGADFIKLMGTGGVVTAGEGLGAPQITQLEMTAACEVAHRAGKRVAAHAIGEVGVREALNAGVDTLEHGVQFSQALINMMLDKQIVLVPTFLPAYIQSTRGAAMNMPAHVVAKASQAWETHSACVARAARAGVPIAAGTDAGGPGALHGDLRTELQLMLAGGVFDHPAECLVAATATGARALGLADQLGTLEAGKLADVLVIDGDPTVDLAQLSRIETVVKAGQIYDLAASQAL